MKVGSEMGSLNDILYPTVETVDFFYRSRYMHVGEICILSFFKD